MLKEFELQTLNRWILSPASQDSENLASRSHETRRIPDPYIFCIKEGKLKTPNGENVEDSVSRGNYVYESEFIALKKIQEWADGVDSGISFWFSPPYSGGYSSLKIVASEILYAINGEKIMFNRAIVLDVGIVESLEIASKISGITFSNPEELRSNPIFLASGQGWLNVLSKYTNQTGQIEFSEDIGIKDRTLSEINIIYNSVQTENFRDRDYQVLVEVEAQKRGLIGDKKDSCTTGSGQSAFSLFFGNALTEGSMGSFPCPRCNGPIPSGLGITICPHCGLTKEEAGSTCG